MSTYTDYKADGYDSIRLAIQCPITGVEYPQEFAMPDEAAQWAKIDDLIAAGVLVIVGVETQALYNSRYFYTGIDVDYDTGVITILDEEDMDPDDVQFRRNFEALLAHQASLAATRNQDALMFELWAGEPGWAFRDTPANKIAPVFHPNIGFDLKDDAGLRATYAADLSAFATRIATAQPGWNGQHNTSPQKILASTMMQAACIRLTDAVRAEAPDLRVIWCGPGFGTAAGPPMYNLMDPAVRPNCLLGFHDYQPRALTHNEPAAANYSALIWPDPTGAWQAQYASAGDRSNVAFQMNNGTSNLPWTAASLQSIWLQAKAYCDSKGVDGIVTEFGALEAYRLGSAVQAHIADKKAAISGAGLLGKQEWRFTG